MGIIDLEKMRVRDLIPLPEERKKRKHHGYR